MFGETTPQNDKILSRHSLAVVKHNRVVWQKYLNQHIVTSSENALRWQHIPDRLLHNVNSVIVLFTWQLSQWGINNCRCDYFLHHSFFFQLLCCQIH